MVDSISRISLFVALHLSCLAFGKVTIAQIERETPATTATLMEFLDKHRLADLSESHFLRQLQLASSRENQIAAARELAAFYIKRASETEEKLEFDLRLVDLLKRFPELDNSAFQLGKLQATYRSNKDLFQEWIEKQRRDDVRAALRNQWIQFQQELESQIALIENEAATEISNESDSENLSQMKYLLAWTQYYRGLVADTNEQQNNLFNESAKTFRQLLELADDQRIDSLDESWLSLTSAWNARCLIGLGMAAEAGRQDTIAEQCFAKLSGSNVQSVVKNEHQQWRFHSFYFPGKLESAATFADRLFSEKIDNVALWSAIVVAGRVWIDPDSADARRLSLTGLAALASSNRFDVIGQLVEQHRITLGTNSFYSNWINAQLSLDRFEHSLDPQHLESASRSIQSAIEMSNVEQDRNAVANVKWLSAWILYKQNRLASAAERFQELALQFRFSRPDLASRALWMRIQMLESDDVKLPLNRIQLESAQADLRRWFPQSRFVQMAEFQQQRKLINRLEPQESIRRLEMIDEQNPNFELARFDIVQACFRCWDSAQKLDGETSEQLSELLTQTQFYLRNFPDAAPTRRLNCGLLLVDAMLQQQPPLADEAKQWLDSLRQVADEVGDSQSVKGDFYFQMMRYATTIGDKPLANQSATWLSTNGSTSSQKNSGLIWLIEESEDRLADARSNEQESIRRETAKLYSDLIANMKVDGMNLSQSPNFRVALFKLAELQMEIKNYQAASENFDALLVSYPNNAQFLLGSARSNQLTGKTENAMESWRTLARGSPVASETWFEAKYFLILELDKKDRHQAGLLLKQTIQLAPEIPAKWQSQFDKLIESFNN